jgi:hypothetical protein
MGFFIQGVGLGRYMWALDFDNKLWSLVESTLTNNCIELRAKQLFQIWLDKAGKTASVWVWWEGGRGLCGAPVSAWESHLQTGLVSGGELGFIMLGWLLGFVIRLQICGCLGFRRGFENGLLKLGLRHGI